MALVRIDEKTLIQKIKFLIIGNEKPNWATRVSVLIGFAIWIYYITYLSVIFLSILFVDKLENPELIRSTFGSIGGKYNFNILYESMNWAAIDVILYHALISICLLFISLLGLIFIYRRKKMGYILYLIGNSLTAIFTAIFLGLLYLKDQITMFDKLLFLGITVYFLIAMFFLKREKKDVEITEKQLS